MNAVCPFCADGDDLLANDWPLDANPVAVP